MKNRALIHTGLTVVIPILIKVFAIKFLSENIELNIYGIIAIIETITLGLTQVLLSVPVQSFNRFYNESKNKEKIINEFKTSIYFSSLLIILILPPLYIVSFDDISIKSIILSVLYAILINNYSSKQNILIISFKRKIYMIFQVSESLIKISFPIFGYLLLRSLDGYLLGLVLSGLVMNAFISIYTKSNFKRLIKISDFKKYILFAYPILITTFAAWSISFSDRFLIKTFISNEALGKYSLLAQLAAMGQILGSIFTLYVNPIILELYESNKKEAYLKLSNYLLNLVFLSLLVLIFVFLLPIDFISLFINKTIISENYYVFIILVVSIIFAILQNSISLYFVLEKKLLLHAKFYIAVAIINIILNFSLISYGIIGLSIATLVSYILLTILMTFAFLKGKIDS